ncbi:MAG: glycosyltransferase family 4 protein [Anaerolineae bacterium]|nr:MAG: glycosyltransferase family 4 protein [Anaerolineae bacterium]
MSTTSFGTKIAFVTPWYGPHIVGGAETVARKTAIRLRRSGLPVEVLTTCVKGPRSNWSHNHFRAGISNIEDVPVRRFRARRRDAASFNQVNWKLLHGASVTPEEEDLFLREMINSDRLYRYIKRHQNEYLYFFIPYLFGTTYYGVVAAPERAFIIPALHNEPYAHMAIYQRMFETARGLLFLSPAEMALAQRLYNLPQERLWLIGAAVDTDIQCDASAFQRKYDLDDPFILYVGRREPGKNTPLLLEYFATYKRRTDGPLKLVLIGDGEVSVPPELASEVLDLGVVSHRDKLDAHAAASALCQPSINESFSLVLMDSWLCGTPVLVHAQCQVTHAHCRHSNGGLWFNDYYEFKECINFLLHHPDASDRMAANGQRYVKANYNWDVIVERYQRLLEYTWQEMDQSS